jgi:transposase
VEILLLKLSEKEVVYLARAYGGRKNPIVQPHESVCHSRGEYARDDDGDGFHEMHVNTMEGFWSLLRSWLRPHRGISQENLPLYLGFFEFVHNVRRRGKALLGELRELLLT